MTDLVMPLKKINMAKRSKLLFFICIFSFVSARAQLKPGQIDPKKVPGPSQHYLPEYTFDKPSDPAAWKKEKRGLSVTFASTDELYLRSEVPRIKQQNSWEETGWKGERLN